MATEETTDDVLYNDDNQPLLDDSFVAILRQEFPGLSEDRLAAITGRLTHVASEYSSWASYVDWESARE